MLSGLWFACNSGDAGRPTTLCSLDATMDPVIPEAIVHAHGCLFLKPDISDTSKFANQGAIS